MLKFSFLLLYDKKFCLQLAMNLAGLGTTTRHHNGVSETRKNTENVKASVTKWLSHNEYRYNAIINSFCLKNMVTLSRAQLWNLVRPHHDRENCLRRAPVLPEISVQA